jgi:hypothetical protein
MVSYLLKESTYTLINKGSSGVFHQQHITNPTLWGFSKNLHAVKNPLGFLKKL